MDKLSSIPVNIRILIAGLVIISIIFTVLYKLELDQGAIQKEALSHKEATIQGLQQQLAALKKINSELANNYIQIQENQRNTESELQELIGQDWEKKYETTLFEKNLLSDEFTNTRYQQDIDITRLERAHEFLSHENNSLKKSVMTQTVANEQLVKTIEEIEAETRQLKNTIAKLKKPPEPTPPPEPSQPDTSVSQSTIKNDPAPPAADKSDLYRQVRLQSLVNTMANQDSAMKQKILISVIPTIPEGISGAEFLALTNNMKSEDILAVLQNTHQYINQPLDNNIMKVIASRMNDADMAAAGPILSSSGKNEKK